MNREYFDRVYRTTYPNLMKYAIVHLSDPTDAEDVLQNVYVQFFRRIEKFGRFDILIPEAFLNKMLKHEIVKHYAMREKTRVYIVSETEQGSIPDEELPEDVALDHALAQEIFQAAKELPKETFRTFVLFYGYDLTVPEIAKRLGIGQEAVKTRLHRARAALREKLCAKEEQQKKTEM